MKYYSYSNAPRVTELFKHQYSAQKYNETSLANIDRPLAERKKIIVICHETTALLFSPS